MAPGQLFENPDNPAAPLSADELQVGRWYATYLDVPQEWGGDLDPDQISPYWERRMVLRRRDNLWAVLSTSYYLARRAGEQTTLNNQIEAIVCSDLDDPGGTEITADYRYRTIETPGAAVPADARKACAAAPTPAIGWGGGDLISIDVRKACAAAPIPAIGWDGGDLIDFQRLAWPVMADRDNREGAS